ncbi:MAG: hypothetical protein FJ102_01965 [Deltaproteobacteria bacterium]|nr:hypothetical protein [Deltaproteobacteria bacterium]
MLPAFATDNRDAARRLLAVAAWGTLLGACAAPPEEQDFPEGAPRALAFETEHFEYYADEPVCETLGTRLEEDYEAVTGYLGVADSVPRAALLLLRSTVTGLT